MNTIKLFFSTAGRTARCDKNFPLYCGQFQNVLLNIYVPTAILAPDFEIQHFIGNYKGYLPIVGSDIQVALYNFVLANTRVYVDGELVGREPEEGDVVFYTNTSTGLLYNATYHDYLWRFEEVPYFSMGDLEGTNVKVGVIATETNGTQYKSKSYYCRYVKKLTLSSDGVEYAIYERKMPREFTAAIGSGQAARTVVINVTNTSENKVDNIVTSQTVDLDVLPSTQLDGEEPLEASDKDEIWSAINGVIEDLSGKQDIRPVHIENRTEVSDLKTQSDTIVGAINELVEVKQDKTDSNLDTTDKTIVGAINELDEKKQDQRPLVDGESPLSTDANTIVEAINEVDAHADAANEQAETNKRDITSLKGRMDDVELVAAGAAAQAETNRQDIAGLKPRMTAVEQVADAANQRSIANAQEITNIEAIIGTGEDFIGTLTINYDPTLPENYTQLSSDLADFVQEQVSRSPKGGDSVIIVEEVAGQTDRNFKYIYTGTEWHGYEIPPMELASYDSAGLVSGTYRVTSPQTPQEKNYDTLVYIDGGEIKNIYIKIDGVYEDFRTVILGIIGSVSNIVIGATPVGEAVIANTDSAGNNIATQFAKILSGASKVGAASAADAATAATNDSAGNNIALQFANILLGATKVGASAAADTADTAAKDSAGNNIATQFANILSGITQVGSAAYAAAALRATQDALGNNIVNTYLTQTLGATKQFVQDYALPKEFNNVLYYYQSPTDDSVYLSENSPVSAYGAYIFNSNIGESTPIRVSYTLGNVKFQLSRKNSFSARICIHPDVYNPQASANLQYKMYVYAQKVGQQEVLLAADLLPTMPYPTDYEYIDFGAQFTELGESAIELTEGDKLFFDFVFIKEESGNTSLAIFSNSVYPSRVNLNTSTQTITYRVTELGEALYIPLTTNDLTVTGGNAYFVTQNADFARLVNGLLEGELAISIPDLSLVTGITEASNIYLNNIPLSSAKNTPAELKDFEIFKRQNGAYLLFGLLRNSATEIAVDAPNINTIPKTARETKQVAANAWTADANISPFAYTYTTTFSQDNTIFGKVTLVASPIVLCKYGIVIGEISGTNVTFYAQELPLEDVDLTILFENEKEVGGNRATDQYGNPLTDEYGVQLYLE